MRRMRYCQLFVLIVRFTFSLQSRALHEKYRDHYEAEKQKTDQKSVPFERVTQLYSKASKAHVQIIGRKVNALGEDGSPHGELLLLTVSFFLCTFFACLRALLNFKHLPST